MSFVHLHNHTRYSLLDGLSSIKALVSKAKELGQPAIAITDHGNMSGIVEFYKECKKQEIKPIIGEEFYICEDLHERVRERFHIILLARNKVGYQNLLKLSSYSHRDGFYYKPRIDMNLLKDHSEGLIMLTACMQGEIPQLLLNDKKQEAKEKLEVYKNLFGKEYVFIELQYHKIPEQGILNDLLLELADETQTKCVVTNDTHYIKQEDASAHDILLCIQTAKKLKDPERMSFSSDQFWLKSEEEMRATYSYPDDAFTNTLHVADLCNVEITLGEYYFPEFGVSDPEAVLKKKCYEALPKKYPLNQEEAKKRLDYELSVINTMGFAAYFLIVEDFISWAWDHDVYVGVGRGSGAGSIANYLLGITGIDPLKHNLLFERFLNPARVSLPDIDVDFDVFGRDKVLHYVHEKYGEDHVAQIATFGQLSTRSVIKDIGRVLNIPFNTVNFITKFLGKYQNIKEEIKENEKIQEFILEFPDLFKYAQVLEGCYKSVGMHAAGVVIGKKRLEHYAPLMKGKEGETLTQFDMHGVEDVGLIKFDFLGLKNLNIIYDSAKEIGIDINDVPLDDKETFIRYQNAETVATFQTESYGMRAALREILPTDIEDIIAVIALHRPGSKDFIPDYAKAKNDGQENITIHPKVEEILKSTYGTIVYQEQVMEIFRILAGFTPKEVDIIRKAIGKKIISLFNSFKDQFISGVKKTSNIQQKEANKLWAILEKFAYYSFNKAHSTAYAYLSYWTCYLKTHYPTEFFKNVLRFEVGNEEKLSLYIRNALRNNVKFLLPNINSSKSNFSLENNKIRFGFEAIKGIGPAAIQKIIENRPYKDETDFFSRCKIDKTSILNLIKCGGLRELNDNMKSLEHLSGNLPKDPTQTTLFGHIDVKIPEIEDYTKEEKLAFEKEILCHYITAHPVDLYPELSDCKPLLELEDEEEAIIGGKVLYARTVLTKKERKQMMFLKIEDKTKTIDLVIFPSTFEQINEQIKGDLEELHMIKVKGKKKEKNFIVEEVLFHKLNIEEEKDNENNDDNLVIPVKAH